MRFYTLKLTFFILPMSFLIISGMNVAYVRFLFVALRGRLFCRFPKTVRQLLRVRRTEKTNELTSPNAD